MKSAARTTNLVVAEDKPADSLRFTTNLVDLLDFPPYDQSNHHPMMT